MQSAVPKYQAIYTVLRQQILDGDYAAGSRLPSQQELADAFAVTLMTLRQAISALESDGLVWAARGKGTFVSDRPVDISLGNLSSLGQQMRAAGVPLETEVLAISVGAEPRAAQALGVDDELRLIVRRRTVSGIRFGLQRSFLDASIQIQESALLGSEGSLYGAIESATGWSVVRAKESIMAVSLESSDATLLDCDEGHPALLSVRTSINQFGQPFLYDEAHLVGGRSVIEADRTSDRLSLSFDHVEV
jgi:GntR family transcriptional regulator